MKKLYYFSSVATMAVAMLCGTACQEVDSFHYPFEVQYDNNNNYTAFINVGYLNQYGMSVRYVFEPK